MSHIVTITVEVRDVAAVRAAYRRLNLSEPVEGEVNLYSGTVSGLAVQLPDWNYPICCDLATGEVHYDNFDIQQEHIKKYGEQFLALQSFERGKTIGGPGGGGA